MEKFVNLWIIYSKSVGQPKGHFFMDRQVKVLWGSTNYISPLTKEKESWRLWDTGPESVYFTEGQGMHIGYKSSGLEPSCGLPSEHCIPFKFDSLALTRVCHQQRGHWSGPPKRPEVPLQWLTCVYSLEVYHLPGLWPLNCKLIHRFSLDLHTNNEGLEGLGCNKSPLVGRPIQNHGWVTIIRVSARLVFPASQGGRSVTQEKMRRLLLCLSPILMMILLLWKYV